MYLFNSVLDFSALAAVIASFHEPSPRDKCHSLLSSWRSKDISLRPALPHVIVSEQFVAPRLYANDMHCFCAEGGFHARSKTVSLRAAKNLIAEERTNANAAKQSQDIRASSRSCIVPRSWPFSTWRHQSIADDKIHLAGLGLGKYQYKCNQTYLSYSQKGIVKLIWTLSINCVPLCRSRALQLVYLIQLSDARLHKTYILGTHIFYT